MAVKPSPRIAVILAVGLFSLILFEARFEIFNFNKSGKHLYFHAKHYVSRAADVSSKIYQKISSHIQINQTTFSNIFQDKLKTILPSPSNNDTNKPTLIWKSNIAKKLSSGHDHSTQTKNPESLKKADINQFESVKDVHDFIWNKIDEIQSEGDCEKKKLFHCKNLGNYAGFGSMVFRFAACLQMAFALGRTMFIYQSQYEHFGGLSKWMDINPGKCQYLKQKYQHHDNRCNLKNRKCYTNDFLEVDNSYKIVEYNIQMVFPVPRYIPSTIPKFIEDSLIKFEVKDPWLWFTSQFLGYLLLRPKPDFRNVLEGIKSSVMYDKVSVSVHIRRGDKTRTGEGKYKSDEQYITELEKLYKDKTKPTKEDDKRVIYVASDSKLSHFKRIIGKNYLVQTLPEPFLSKGLQSYFSAGFSSAVLESIIIDLNLLAYTNFTICTMSSNVCRVAYLLKNAIPPYNATNRVVGLDLQQYFSRYTWQGYDVPEIYYLTMKSRSNFKVKANNKEYVLNYEKGNLFSFVGSRLYMDERNIVNQTANEMFLYEMVPRYQASKQRITVLNTDVIEWPGRPEYPVFSLASSK